MATQKAGCILIDRLSHKVGIIYRDYRNDYSFPKGHVEKGETAEECAVRETAEETKRDCIIADHEPYIERYTTSYGEECECYMYIAWDNGHSDNDSTDTHDLMWIDFDQVENKLTYPSLVKTWRVNASKIHRLINKSR